MLQGLDQSSESEEEEEPCTARRRNISPTSDGYKVNYSKLFMSWCASFEDRATLFLCPPQWRQWVKNAAAKPSFYEQFRDTELSLPVSYTPTSSIIYRFSFVPGGQQPGE